MVVFQNLRAIVAQLLITDKRGFCNARVSKVSFVVGVALRLYMFVAACLMCSVCSSGVTLGLKVCCVGHKGSEWSSLAAITQLVQVRSFGTLYSRHYLMSHLHLGHKASKTN